jgi:hypothetical protein
MSRSFPRRRLARRLARPASGAARADGGGADGALVLAGAQHGEQRGRSISRRRLATTTLTRRSQKAQGGSK